MHTEGPWEVSPFSALDFCSHSVCEKTDRVLTKVIAHVVKHDGATDNAHLIAAAPELLEALKAMYRMDWRIGPTNNEYALAAAAILKATK